MFGSSNEQLDRAQLELLLQLSASATPVEPTAVIPPKKEVKVQPRKVRAPRLPEHLPVIEEVIEPFLIQEGFVQRTPRGRLLTRLAFAHLGLALPANLPAQLELLAPLSLDGEVENAPS